MESIRDQCVLFMSFVQNIIRNANSLSRLQHNFLGLLGNDVRNVLNLHHRNEIGWRKRLKRLQLE